MSIKSRFPKVDKSAEQNFEEYETIKRMVSEDEEVDSSDEEIIDDSDDEVEDDGDGMTEEELEAQLEAEERELQAKKDALRKKLVQKTSEPIRVERPALIKPISEKPIIVDNQAPVCETKEDFWYGKGFESIQKAEEELKQQPRRFWLKEGTETEIIFIDNAPFVIYEHNLKINGNWYNYFTCTQDIHGKCPLCEAGFKRYYVGLFNIVSCQEWTDKEGKKHANEVKVLAAKLDVMKKLQNYFQKRGGLAGCKYTVFRSTKRASSCGDDFQFVDKVNVKKLFPDMKLYNFEEVCKPLSLNVLNSKVSRAEKFDTSFSSDEDAF